MQRQFNVFVVNLRQQYGVKVKTFRHVIELHRNELQQKQTHWDEALSVRAPFLDHQHFLHSTTHLCIVCVHHSLQSLSSKNKQLLNDKKGLLIQNKVEIDRLGKEKVGASHPQKHAVLKYMLCSSYR